MTIKVSDSSKGNSKSSSNADVMAEQMWEESIKSTGLGIHHTAQRSLTNLSLDNLLNPCMVGCPLSMGSINEIRQDPKGLLSEMTDQMC